jgi:hypothetical protein
MKKLIKKHQAGSAIDSFTKSKAYNSIPATIVKVFDPTGISSYGDVYNAWTDGKFDYQDVLEPLGAIPVVGKLGKVGKFLGKGIKGFNELEDAKKIVSVGMRTVGRVGGVQTARGLKGSSAVKAYENYFNPLLRGEDRVAAIAKRKEFNRASELLNKSKLLNYGQYTLRTAGSVGDAMSAQNNSGITMANFKK